MSKEPRRSPLSRPTLALAALALAAAALAGTGEWTSAGPAGSVVYAFASSPSSPSKVFSLGPNGLLRSEDGGSSWVTVNPHHQDLLALTVAPSVSSTLYAINYVTHDVERSEDDGVSWRSFNTHLADDDYPLSLAVDSISTSTLYLGTSVGVLKSDDGGQTWAGMSGLPEHNFQALAIDPSNPSTIYAAGGPPSGQWGEIYRSTDRGASWTLATSNLSAQVTCLEIDPARPATLYGCIGTGVVRSVDGGASWTSILSSREAYGVAIGSSSVYAATYGALYRGNPDGSSWSTVRFGPEDSENASAGTSAITLMRSSPAALLVGGRNGILRSTDGGDHWTVVDTGGRASVRAVAVSASHPGLVLAGGDGGVFRSTNSGASWTQPDLATPGTQALAFAGRDPSTIYAGGLGGVSKSIDGGATWRSKGRLASTAGVAVSPFDSSVILAGTIFGQIFMSDDGGEYWGKLSDVQVEGVEYPPVPRSIVFDPVDPSILYVAGEGSSYFGEGALYKSVDGGAHWVVLLSGGWGSYTVVVDPDLPSTLYVGRPDGILKSLDAGATWTHLSGPTGAAALVIDPHTATLYSGGSGVWQSFDGGGTWGFLGGPDEFVTSLALDSEGQRIFAGTPNGVFDLDLSAESPGPCRPAPGTLCLLGGRFRVTVSATDARRAQTSPGFAVAQDDRFGYFSLPDFTGDATLPEVFVKMVDGSWQPGGAFWVFYNGLTSLPYTMVVTDTSTGARRTYQSDGACGGADTAAFPGGHPAAQTVIPATQSTLAASGQDLLLLGDRFRITLSATNPRNGRVTTGSAIAQGDRFGYFSLPDFTGDPNFPEVCVKMIDATSFNGNFWFFYTSLTSLSYTLTVTDSATGAVQTYQNGTAVYAFCGGADTRAFPK